MMVYIDTSTKRCAILNIYVATHWQEYPKPCWMGSSGGHMLAHRYILYNRSFAKITGPIAHRGTPIYVYKYPYIYVDMYIYIYM